MEWLITFPDKQTLDDTKSCWNKMVVHITNPLTPLYAYSDIKAEKLKVLNNNISYADNTINRHLIAKRPYATSTIRVNDLGDNYSLEYLIFYWKEHVLPSTRRRVLSTLTFAFDGRGLLTRLRPTNDVVRFPDVEFLVDNHSFYAHKAVLDMVSVYFNALFSIASDDSTSQPIQIITIDDVTSTIFEMVLNSLYGHRIIIDGINGVRWLFVCKRFLIKEIDDITIKTTIQLAMPGEEDLPEFVRLISLIYSGIYPEWFHAYFIESIATHAIDNDTQKLFKLFDHLPVSFKEYFDDNYTTD